MGIESTADCGEATDRTCFRRLTWNTWAHYQEYLLRLTPIDSNWNSAEAATSSFAVSWELNVWVRLPHASANCLMIRLPLWESKPKK